MRLSKMAPDTNRHNFASNNFEYKLKASTLTLHVANRKLHIHKQKYYRLRYREKLNELSFESTKFLK